MSAEILTLDKDQLKFLLKNHECFSRNEVKIAAKLLAQGKYKRKLVGYNSGCSCMDQSALQRGCSPAYTPYASSLNPRGIFGSVF